MMLPKQHEKSRDEAAFSMLLYGGIGLPFYRYAVAFYLGLSALAGAKDYVDIVVFCFRHIAVAELIFSADSKYFKALAYQVCAELPEFFEHTVAVKNSGNVLGGMICRDPEIICHSYILLISNCL